MDAEQRQCWQETTATNADLGRGLLRVLALFEYGFRLHTLDDGRELWETPEEFGAGCSCWVGRDEAERRMYVMASRAKQPYPPEWRQPLPDETGGEG